MSKWFYPGDRAVRRRLAVQRLEDRLAMASLPYGAMEQDTAEFMLGRVAVTPVFLESNGQLDASTENWTQALIEETLQTIETGLDWWVDMLATRTTVHSLQFVIDRSFAVNPAPTRYEPISRVSNDYVLWTEEFLSNQGYTQSSNVETNMRAFNHAQREKLGTDWSFTMFVVNSKADVDGQFAPNGSFSRAFAFAGGLFLISPSTRPASTFTHEVGHMFWAKDEYAGGGSSGDRRGYYNTPNSNAADNNSPGFVQQPSIMASGALLDTAYNNYVSPASTLAMIGWQDSDGDGIFDVLDVPLQLEGTGYYDAATALYRFQGSARVGTLANLNSEGLRNDITLNRVSQIQYRLDGGAWLTASSPNEYSVNLDLSIPLPNPGQVIELRAIDTPTGMTSNVFQGRLDRSSAVTGQGIHGFVWIDVNKNGIRDPQESGQAGWTMELLSGAGQSLSLRKAVEPDALPDGALAAGSIAGVTITAVGNDTDGRAGVFSDSSTSTGTKTFRAYSRSTQSWLSTWSTATRRMRVDMASPTSVVDIDVVGAVADAYGRLEAYDASNRLIDRATTGKLSVGQIARLRVESATGEIAYVLIGGHANTTVRLDNLRIGPETIVTSAVRGQYSVPWVPAGSYQVRATPPSSYSPVGGNNNPIAVTIQSGGTVSDADLGFVSTSNAWQNSVNQYDVNGQDGVTALDVLLIINHINDRGPFNLADANFQSPPFVDVNADGFCTALDALLVINVINARGDGEGEDATEAVAATDMAIAQEAWSPWHRPPAPPACEHPLTSYTKARG